jgi:D-glycerate 3-kinase
MPKIRDDKSQHVIPFILSLHSQHKSQHGNSTTLAPFFIGLNGVQGVGKSVLVDSLKIILSSPPHNLCTVVLSLDDLYLTHSDQLKLAKCNRNNPLLQHRGQPSTHDIPLAISVFHSLKFNKPTKMPQYNKAAFAGKGDRVPSKEWEEVNRDPSNPVRIVLFEGWSVGFRSLSPEILASKHSAAVKALQDSTSSKPYRGRLGHCTFANITTINNALKSYDALTGQLDAFIHIDAEDPLYVYTWRTEQEAGLRATEGSGMTDDLVRRFVDGYYPAYELYTETLQQGAFKGIREDWQERQLRLVVGEDRRVTEVIMTMARHKIKR